MTWAEGIAGHRSAVDTHFAVLSRTPRQALAWVTVVIGVYKITVSDDIADAARAAVDTYHAERAAAFRRSGRTYRSQRGWTRWCGSVELDIIHPVAARKLSGRKAGLLVELGIDVTAMTPDQRVVILHEHAVIDHRGHASIEALKRDMRAVWPGDRRVHVARLHDEDSVRANLGRLAGYATKMQERYSVAWDGRRTSYLKDYEPEWRTFVRDLYERIGVTRMLSTNLTVQSAASLNDRGMHTEPSSRRAKYSRSQPIQLYDLNDISDRPTHNPHGDTEVYTLNDNKEISDMKASEIIGDYLDPEAALPAARRDLENATARRWPGLSPSGITLMYGNGERENRVEQQRLDAEKTRAEIDRIRAAAARDRAEAQQIAGESAEPPSPPVDGGNLDHAFGLLRANRLDHKHFEPLAYKTNTTCARSRAGR